ncbi:MAG TPA: DUF2306 domain-containing protein [Rhizomicrobium sp.]|nr:DUF2306 domain-containing protein [Rhizomicrobium sp.]
MHVHDITFIGWFHSIGCLIALVAGAWNLAAVKGTPRHRAVGRIYVWAMIALNLSSLALYRFDIAHFAPFRAGPNVFGFFHWLAIATLMLVLVGYYASSRQERRPWAYIHPSAMVLSYYMLIGGGINEVFARLDPLRALARASAGAGNAANAPIIGLVQTAAMAGTLLLILYFIVKAALYRRRAKI